MVFAIALFAAALAVIATERVDRTKVALLGAVLLLLRRRTGAALQAIRDDEDAAASVGVRTRPLKLILFVLAGVGCGAAGAAESAVCARAVAAAQGRSSPTANRMLRDRALSSLRKLHITAQTP
jgi:ribose/xylose/arabinose/galactoside ABC-type transport system permease subunit